MATDWKSIFQEHGAVWVHDGKAQRPHALLVSGLHSDGFVNCGMVTQDARLLQRIVGDADGLAPVLPTQVDWVIGSAMGAVTFAFALAAQLGANAGFTEKDGDAMKLARFEVKPGQKVLVVEDTISTGGSTLKTIEGIKAAGVAEENILPYIVCLVNRSGATTLAGRELRALLTPEIHMWKQDECPLCKIGSTAVPTKSELGPVDSETLIMRIPELTSRPAEQGGIFRAVLLAIFLPGWTVLWGSWCVLAGWLKKPRMFHFGITAWARGILIVAGIKVECLGSETLPSAACVFMSNHQSALDIPILVVACNRAHDVRFMAKEVLFKIPFLGWGISGNGFIPIRRENARHAANTFKEIVAKNSSAFSYIVFPEGTRSDDGRMRDFKRGAIALVMQLGKPLIPVSIIDACRANPKGRWLVRAGIVRVVFHAALEPDLGAFGGDERMMRDELTKRAQTAVAGVLPDGQRP